MIDTHCHLTYDGLFERVGDVIAAARAAGVDRMISVGTTPDDARKALQLAHDHACVFATAGIHPHYVAQLDLPRTIAELRVLAANDRLVALGEMGLDRHYPEPPLDVQRGALAAQLDLARDFPYLPIIIHNREATDETLVMLRDSGLPPQRFVFHCFTGSGASGGELDAILDFGAMVGFTGITTFKNARDLAEASDRVPLDRLLIETDSPYLTPEPHRKVRPNEPKYVVEVARFLAARRGMNVEGFTATVDANAERFFRLPLRG